MTLGMLLVRSNLFMGLSVCLIFDIQYPSSSGEIEVSSPAPEHVIKPDKLRFLIGLPIHWKSPIRRLHSNQAGQLSLIE